MAGGGVDFVPVSPRAQQPRGGRAQAAARGLPLDVVVEIAVRSDAATLVRCAATCRDARRRIAEDPNLRARLRLRDTGRFLLPLLRGHLTGIKINDLRARLRLRNEKTDVYLVDTTAAEATPLVRATFASSETSRVDPVPVDSRGGLVLVRATVTSTAHPWHTQLLVCNPDTRRRLALPPEPPFPLLASWSTGIQYVLLVGDSDGEGGAAVGRPFHVLKAMLVLSEKFRSYRRLLVHTFSSEHGAWSRWTDIPTPNLLGFGGLGRRPLVVGDVVHWLCLTSSGSYVLMLHVRAGRVNETTLPASFPRDDGTNNNSYDDRQYQYLLATASAGGNPVVLVADTDKISAWEWEQSSKMWKPWPQVVIENEAILGFNDETTELVKMWAKHVPKLVWFGEKSGAVLLRIYRCCLLWLDLHSNKIVRFTSSDRPLSYAKVYCPYEVDSSSWVPTFSRAGAFRFIY